MSGWAIDLGTTNTGLSRWDRDADRARMVELQRICRRPGRAEPLEAPRLIPSAVHLLPPESLADRVARSGWLGRRVLWGRLAEVGRPALERNQGWMHPAFAESFKPLLGLAPNREVARLQGQGVSAREVARVFLREVVAEVKRSTGERIRELVFTVPVESYDAYRAELKAMAAAVGIGRVRFVDEPVAAAIGYGLGLSRARRVLVVDFGGGTLDLAVVELTPRSLEQGSCRVLAKEGRPVGGNTVDEWLLGHFSRRLQVPRDMGAVAADELVLWRRLMRAEARRVKEAVYFDDQAVFELAPPAALRSVTARLGGEPRYVEFDREGLRSVLAANHLYGLLEDCADGIARQLDLDGSTERSIDDVLLVGGSTLLPGVFPLFEARYGRDRVRAWQPFEAVAYGASAYAADRYAQSDFVVHDYAFLTYDPHDPEQKIYTTIVPQGTRFPSGELWRRHLVPTCALGEPERVFKLVVCEIAGQGHDRRFAWDAEGNVHRLGERERPAPIIVPLNEANPTLGYLDPPHEPGDRSPRLEIAFGVDGNRWLVATVRDLRVGRLLMDREPVVRVL
ncbi:MAG: Hsp70 family protein [bacterium]